jgi:integrase
VATITRLKSGSWRVQVRRKGKYVNETFLRRKDAEEWGIDIERRIDRQEPTTTRQSRDVQLFGDLITLHRQDLEEVGKDIGRSKTASLIFLDERLGHLRLPELDRERFIKFGKARALEGAGPVTVGIDLLIRNRKDPRRKKGNDQRIPLLDVSGYDACKIIEEQARFSNIREGRIFPYNGRSVGTAFRRQCRELKIDDLHFHDLRHEGTSRLFEAGFSIEQVALVTGHKDWKMLRRYTHLKPETLHSIRSVRVA